MRRFLSGLLNGTLALSLIYVGTLIANKPAGYLDLGSSYFEPFQRAKAAQGSLCMPTTGTVSGLEFSQNVNTAFAALVSSNSGTTVPLNDCSAAPIKGQWWLDTSLTPNQAKMYDGTSWLTVAAMDVSGHAWLPRSGDGSLTLPGMAFQAEANTGLRRAASGDLRITIGGVDIVQITSGGLNMLAGTTNTVPVGSVIDYCGPTAPTGWIFGGGQAESRTGDTAALFSTYGTTFGIGNGTTTFNVPDFRGRVIAARDNMGALGSAGRLTSTWFGAAATTVGSVGGVEHHALTVLEMPNHTHGVGGVTSSNNTNHTHSTVSRTGSHHHDDETDAQVPTNHTHVMRFGRVQIPVGTGGGFVLTGGGSDVDVTSEVQSNSHTHQVSTGSQVGSTDIYTTGNENLAHNHTVAAAGSGNSHPNIQPTIICNKIVKL